MDVIFVCYMMGNSSYALYFIFMILQNTWLCVISVYFRDHSKVLLSHELTLNDKYFLVSDANKIKYRPPQDLQKENL